MRYLTQQSVLWLVLAAHLVAFEWGPSLHRWQCLATGSSSSSGDCAQCCGAKAASDSSGVDLVDPNSGQPGSAPEPHDPRHCSICKFFAHSPAAPLAITLMVKIEAGHEFHVSHQPLSLEAIPSGHLARGPPLWA